MTRVANNQKNESSPQTLDLDFERKLLASKLVSEVHRSPNHVSVTLTGNGVLAFIKALQTFAIEEGANLQPNQNFDELERLKKVAADYAQTRDAVIHDQLIAIETAVNQAMREISLAILKDATHLPPVLRLEKLNKYTFNTPNDGGTGAQYRGLITFDLANMEVAPVPFVVHDSVLLKNIERPVFSAIMQVYEEQKSKGKQVFMAYDTLDSYGEETRKLVETNAVLELSPGGNELFGWAWNKEKKDEASEQE